MSPEYMDWNGNNYCVNCGRFEDSHDAVCDEYKIALVQAAENDDNREGNWNPSFWDARKAYLAGKGTPAPVPNEPPPPPVYEKPRPRIDWARYTGLEERMLRGMK